MARKSREVSPVRQWGPGWKVAVWMRVEDEELFQKWMRKRGFTGAGLARSVGCSPAMISLLSRGRRTCTPNLARKISEALELPEEILFEQVISHVAIQSATPATRKTAA